MSVYLNSSNHIAVGSAIWDEDKSPLWEPQYNYCYQARGPQSARPQSSFFSLWPASRMSSGDPATPLTILGAGSRDIGGWMLWQCGEGGHTTPVFIVGRAVDGGGGILAGAIVKGFRASDDLFVGQTISDSNGNFSLGTPYPSVAHYLVAYEAGSPDVSGTTINTLVPA